MKLPLLDIIIVNWNSGTQLRRCLSSVSAAARDGVQLDRVVVVDNNSHDGSASELDSLHLPLQVIYNRDNLGFAKACNQGAEGSRADYLLFLNPDIQLLEASLRDPLRWMEMPEHRRIGVLGIQLVSESGEISRTCARFPTPGRLLLQSLGLDRLFPFLPLSHFMVKWNHGDSREVDQVMGAFFLVRREVFESIRGFDERFFVYYEDVDFAYRARKAGWLSYYYAQARAEHKGGGTTSQIKGRRLFYFLRGRILYCRKHFGLAAAIALLATTFFLEPVVRIMHCVWQRRSRAVEDVIQGYRMLWTSRKSLIELLWEHDEHESVAS